MIKIADTSFKLGDSSFFSKCYKFNVDSKDVIKMQENNFGFSDNCIWSGSGKFSLLLQEYSYLAVSVSTGGPKIPDLSKNDLF